MYTINFYFAAKLLVVGGVDISYVTKSEIIDLMNPMNECQPWADHPTGTRYAAGAFINNTLHICGGYRLSTLDDCYLISPTSAESSTSLRLGSSYSAASSYQGASGALIYTGGLSKYFSKIRNIVDITFS